MTTIYRAANGVPPDQGVGISEAMVLLLLPTILKKLPVSILFIYITVTIIIIDIITITLNIIVPTITMTIDMPLL